MESCIATHCSTTRKTQLLWFLIGETMKTWVQGWVLETAGFCLFLAFWLVKIKKRLGFRTFCWVVRKQKKLIRHVTKIKTRARFFVSSAFPGSWGRLANGNWLRQLGMERAGEGGIACRLDRQKKPDLGGRRGRVEPGKTRGFLGYCLSPFLQDFRLNSSMNPRSPVSAVDGRFGYPLDISIPSQTKSRHV